MSKIPPLQSLLDIFERAALLTGDPILHIYRAGPDARYKSDASPVTDADERAEAIILTRLATECPGIPVVAEESAAAGRIPDVEGKPFLLVDPLDGTKEFINGNDDFTVNIALIDKGIPVLGFVYAPALGLAYRGSPEGAEKLWVDTNFQVTRRQPMRARALASPDIAVTSRWSRCAQTDAFINHSGASDIRTVGSSLKFCLIAEGAADIYPRFGRTMEWDTAAGDAILRAAGGMTFDLDGHPLTYGKTGRPDCADFANPDFVARCSGNKAR
ncbi:3'(2'),5'-bisphosphate nucleotidase CysQ [Neorhizobium sp. NCHU2750]|uniref:3'(2'),5'-bisphosphate nucleotidase CysQ n=1 Tax=Neorhizobium sp. NCHU2750 TaxID=1825976 RepID=UPI000E74791E|nr:3''-5''-bisphosphate nucleotidase [Neorhizobium sp. NCHU2750]